MKGKPMSVKSRLTLNSQALPPKMAREFAARARAGEGKRMTDECFQFRQNNNIVTVHNITKGDPWGSVKKMDAHERILWDAETEKAS